MLGAHSTAGGVQKAYSVANSTGLEALQVLVRKYEPCAPMTHKGMP